MANILPVFVRVVRAALKGYALSREAVVFPAPGIIEQATTSFFPAKETRIFDRAPKVVFFSSISNFLMAKSNSTWLQLWRREIWKEIKYFGNWVHLHECGEKLSVELGHFLHFHNLWWMNGIIWWCFDLDKFLCICELDELSWWFMNICEQSMSKRIYVYRFFKWNLFCFPRYFCSFFLKIFWK